MRRFNVISVSRCVLICVELCTGTVLRSAGAPGCGRVPSPCDLHFPATGVPLWPTARLILANHEEDAVGIARPEADMLSSKSTNTLASMYKMITSDDLQRATVYMLLTTHARRSSQPAGLRDNGNTCMPQSAS